ncbi:hypothetical protein ACFVT9_29305 [Kitasatospora cineracea]|uniref:hypothetical protein n=1 Tax=Kitasatospora cineracea TaxID=88074 RepID=UPI0036DA3812
MDVVIEEQRFESGGQGAGRSTRARWMAVTGEDQTGKSTGLEAAFLALGPVPQLKLMSAAAACSTLATTLSLGGARWRVSRGPHSSTVEFQDLSGGAASIRLPVSSRTPDAPTASDRLLGLLGVPVLRDGATKLTFGHILPLIYLRQATCGVTYLGGMKPQLRELAVRGVLGLREDAVEAARASRAALRRELAAARRALAGFEKIREQFAFTTPEELAQRRHRTEQDLAEARTAAQAGANELGAAHRRLQELREAAGAAHPAADAADRAADRAERVHREAVQQLGHAEGALGNLRSPAPASCPVCRLRLRTEGLPDSVCPMCKESALGRGCGGGDERIEAALKAVAEAKALEQRLARAAREARAAAAAAHRKVREAYQAADAFAQTTLEPLRRRVLEAEKRVRELSVLAEQLGERFDELVRAIESHQAVVAALAEQVAAADKVVEDEESAARARLAEVLKSWSVHFARQLADAGQEFAGAHIAERGFTPVVDGEVFDQVAVAGPRLALVELVALVSLREVGREIAGSSVPVLIVVDAPLAGLGDARADAAARAYLRRLCADTAAGRGPLSQIITASREALAEETPGARRLHLTPDDRYIPQAAPVRTDAA